MKKIEIIAYKLADGSFVNTDDVTTGDLVRGAESLYTREALEAVAEAVKNAAWKVAYSEEAAEAVSDIDTDAIINQLTGE